MRRLLLALLLFFLFSASPGWAQGNKIYRIGGLVSANEFMPAVKGFKDKMRDFGYVEGASVKYDIRNASGDQQALKKLAQELVASAPDLIVTSSTTATVPVARMTEGNQLPVVFLSAGNPLRFVKSYASSGNNLTGITTSSIDLTAKRLELLREITPGMKRVISMSNPKGQNYQANMQAVSEAAKKLGLELVNLEIVASSREEVAAQVHRITRRLGDAVFIPPDVPFVAAVEEITRQSIKERLPTVGPIIETTRKGFLATYSPSYHDLGRQGAVLVDKILKGAKPSDLPIELPFKLRLVLNRKTAKAMGLKLSREILIRADEVIE